MARPKHAFWIRNGVEHDPVATLELAVAADEAGWDGVFVSDAVQEAHTEPFTQLAAIAARTTRITLGTWVTPLIARDVVHVARSAANVDRLSDGRLLLGFGLGNQVEHDGLGVSRERLGAHFDAALEVLDGLLRGEAVTRHDDWYDLEEVSLNVRPVQEPRPPVLVAAMLPATAGLSRAARWDGVMPFWPGTGEGRDPEVAEGANERELRELLGSYREQAEPGGIVVAPRLERFGAAYDDLCAELGVDWLLSCDPLDVDGVRAGPPPARSDG